jgi:hypothetical protein
MHLLAFLFLFAASFARPLYAGDDVWTFAPSGRLFPITFADPREIRTSVGFGSGKIQANVGSYLSLFSVSADDASWDFHFGLEGKGYFTMRQQGGRFPLETVDGTIGLYFEYGSGDWSWQFRYTHVSANLADGLAGAPIAFSRETVSLRAGYVPSENLHVYAGIHKLVNTMPVVPHLAFQTGVTYFVPVGGSLSPFIAADLRFQGESKANPCFALQLGLALHEPETPRRSFRMYYSYYTGADVRGQFYDQPSTIHSLGLEFPL